MVSTVQLVARSGRTARLISGRPAPPCPAPSARSHRPEFPRESLGLRGAAPGRAGNPMGDPPTARPPAPG